MPINPDAVGIVGTPTRRSWKSKDALLYAVGVGAGTDELEFTTENTKDLSQKVLPTYAVIIGGGGIPFDKIGSFNPAMLVHGEQGIELFDEIHQELGGDLARTIARFREKPDEILERIERILEASAVHL